LAKIKIQTIVGKVENGAERAETQEKVDEERRHQIEVGRLGGGVRMRGSLEVADDRGYRATRRPASSVS
jgi:hypothetical protein